jgi:hypothetical protein
MYLGEVSVRHTQLDTFLAVAEELKVFLIQYTSTLRSVLWLQNTVTYSNPTFQIWANHPIKKLDQVKKDRKGLQQSILKFKSFQTHHS